MKAYKVHILFVWVLALFLSFGAVEVFASSASDLPAASGREAVSFSDLPYYLPEADEIREFINTFVSDFNAASSAEAQIKLIIAFEWKKEQYYDMRRIAGIRASQSPGSDTVADVTYFQNLFIVELDDAFIQAYAAVLASKFIKELEAHFDVGKNDSIIDHYRYNVDKYTPEYMELTMELHKIISDYNTKLIAANEKGVVFEQKKYKLSDLFELWEQEYGLVISEIIMLEEEYGEEFYKYVDQDALRALIRRIDRINAMRNIIIREYNRFNKDADILFSDMMKINEKIAVIDGYSSFLEYGFEAESYDLKDIKAYISNIRKTLLPVYKNLAASAARNKNGVRCPSALLVKPLYNDKNPSEGDSKEMIRLSLDALRASSDEMKSVVDFIEQNGFIDVVPHKDKQSGAYMSYLRGARLPFVYNNYTDPSVIFHEFGHALGAFMSPDSELPLFDDAGIDIKEFEAMGMEVLATLHYDMLYGDTADHARTAFVYRHFHQLIVATLICEFEILLYEKPRLTKGQRENEFYRMCDQYQIGGYLLWSQISHYFDAPAYYKSYVLNFLPTMELYRVAQSDPALAQKMYMDFLRDTDEHDYIARLNKVGLSNPLDEDALEEIALYLRRFFRSDRYWNP